MPKQTFFNLPETKRKNLMDAIKQEFSRAPLFEASIANIVKLANIPRGSFYQYFEDKEDAFYYLLSEQTEAIQKRFSAFLEERKGDLYQAVIDLFAYTLEEISRKNEIHFLKNAFIYITHEVEDIFTNVFSDDMSNGRYQFLHQQIDKEKLNMQNDNDLYHIIQIVTSVTLRNFVEKYANGYSNEEAVKNFTRDMNLLKIGLFK